MQIGNINFSQITFTAAEKMVSEIIEKGETCKQVVVANSFSVVLASKNKEFKEVCRKADIIFADGAPVVWVSSLSRKKIPERIPGPDFMWNFSKICAAKGYKIFLMGGQKLYLSRLKENMEREFPGIQIVGTLSPPYGEWSKEDDERIISAINSSKADVLWVGVSTPKQDIWIAHHKSKIKAKVALGVGAAFDFHSGKVKRAPKWMRKAGFEWLYRFLSEPKRLWKRYLFGNTEFLLIVMKQFIQNRKARAKIRSNK
jgi:N-acetylglucosaminyldiphosphoundecaprenol N-acetyl-beta-D-mannosaminyltransferase